MEAELLETHQEETQQLHRKIAEKDEDLKRTARTYEEILDVLYFHSLLKCSVFMVVLMFFRCRDAFPVPETRLK